MPSITSQTSAVTSHPAGPLAGDIRVPGDKSMSHRALMLGGLAVGETEIHGLLEGDDVVATARAMSALGAGVILHKLGTPGTRAVEQLRTRRPGALFNETFASYLVSL